VARPIIGKRHRADGPAFIEHDAATGIVTREEWFQDGNWHRWHSLDA